MEVGVWFETHWLFLGVFLPPSSEVLDKLYIGSEQRVFSNTLSLSVLVTSTLYMTNTLETHVYQDTLVRDVIIAVLAYNLEITANTR